MSFKLPYYLPYSQQFLGIFVLFKSHVFDNMLIAPYQISIRYTEFNKNILCSYFY